MTLFRTTMRAVTHNATALLCVVVLLWSRAGSGEDEFESVITVDTGERKPVQTVVPVYPELARRERVEGDVQICFNIDREGFPYRVRVRNSTNRIFEKPSLIAARASTFEPLLPGKKLSGIKTCRTFRFRLMPASAEGPD